MSHDVCWVAIWLIGGAGFGCAVYLAMCLDRAFARLECFEAELEAMRLERWAAGESRVPGRIVPALSRDLHN